jgi:predicted naringenin-chalcone synthase
MTRSTSAHSNAAHINAIGTAVPDIDVHAAFLAFARTMLPDDKARSVFDRMAERSGIAHRFSWFRPGRIDAGEVDAEGFFRRGAFPSTGARMRRYEQWALDLAMRAVDALGEAIATVAERARITHVVVGSCTGFSAPGLDLQIAERLGLRASVRRSLLGFMGCSAAVPVLRAAQDAVLADASARVLAVNLELCTLHLQETADLETILSFLLFGDGCSAAIVSADESGIALDDFRNAIIPDSADFITWHIGDQGFDMRLSGKVPGRIAATLRDERARGDADGLLRGEGTQAIEHWAVHAGGRTVLDAVEMGLSLPAEALAHSRAVLNDFGNMSSATVMFVLRRMLQAGSGPGMAMAFGPGMVAETFRFRVL